MKQVDPVELCRANARTARAKSDTERLAMRARFPFAVRMVAELTAARFMPRVLWMVAENGDEWRRG